MASAARRHDPRIDRIAEYLRDTDVTDLTLWDDLDVLSTHTHVEAVEIPTEGIVIDAAGRFTAVLNLYLTLQYGRDDDEGFSTSDSFLAKLSGHVEDGTVVIDHSSVDTSAFYE